MVLAKLCLSTIAPHASSLQITHCQQTCKGLWHARPALCAPPVATDFESIVGRRRKSKRGSGDHRRSVLPMPRFPVRRCFGLRSGMCLSPSPLRAACTRRNAASVKALLCASEAHAASGSAQTVACLALAGKEETGNQTVMLCMATRCVSEVL